MKGRVFFYLVRVSVSVVVRGYHTTRDDTTVLIDIFESCVESLSTNVIPKATRLSTLVARHVMKYAHVDMTLFREHIEGIGSLVIESDVGANLLHERDLFVRAGRSDDL